MLTAVDHAAFTPPKEGEFPTTLAHLGYQQVFSESDIPNPAIKRDLMAAPSQRQSLELYNREDSVDIEIVDHGHVADRPPALVPVLEGLPEEVRTDEGWSIVADQELHRVRVDGLDSIVYHREAEKFRFREAVARTADPEESRRFWSRLGFQEDGDSLTFRSPISGDLRLYLLQDPDHTSSRLDGIGMTCLAFVSSSAKTDRERLSQEGIQTTPVHPMTVDNQRIEVFFAEGPSGEIVEVVSPQPEEDQ